MPVVKIELATGKDYKTLIQIKQSVIDSVVKSLQLPSDDRNVRIWEYPVDHFQMKPPYEIFIEISMFEGRSKETKKALFQEIVNQLENNASIPGEKVFILLNEQPLMNWGVRGGIPADEVDLNMNVNI